MWLKVFLRLRLTRTFGPMFKMLLNMVIDIMPFMAIWLIVLILFASVGLLVFGQLKAFSSFGAIIVVFFSACIGSWSMDNFKGQDYDGDPLLSLEKIGILFQIFFLLVNLVLFLNFVVAILSQTYAFYEDKKLGLFYEVVIGQFPTLDYEETYGANVCAQPPFNLLIFPFQWISFVAKDESFLREFNHRLCLILYFPVAIIVTVSFTVFNIALLPIAYVSHILALVGTITNSDETMDEFSEKMARVVTILKFIVLGPFY